MKLIQSRFITQVHQAVAACLILAAAGCNILPDEVSREQTVASQAALEVKTALINAGDIDAAPIRVRAENGGAILIDGFVDSKAKLERVKSIVAQAAGDSPFNINLTIK